ncbi:FtsK/SpoIIIE domain-containing protein [Terribacillus saccharophilus]|uniref:FtsK/SpoIIIE domain-containing protein n=1 Tax=Terribacillus saccharophilus TaxID=361277 RepID=UPI000BA7B0A9|nr:FtsK/SpoIIIE domain-containing protein [Terribacillus saccharophilus]PAF19768.1 cell division protein FtsK [Terribacillus saccharophilus]
MLFEGITIACFGGVALYAKYRQSETSNDSDKIQQIFTLSGLNVKHGGKHYTTQLLKKRKYDWGTEYRYRIPLGRSFNDFAAKQDVLEDGLNRRRLKLNLPDLKALKNLRLDKNIIRQIQDLYQKQLTNRKEIELSYDGALIIRVYDHPLPKQLPYAAGEGWKVPVGITRQKNEYLLHDFEKLPHIVLGGATQYGKSNYINSIISSLLKTKPDHVHFYLIDLKGGVELCDYENIRQTEAFAYEPEEALQALKEAYEKMRNIQELVRNKGKKKIWEAGIKDRYFVIIDEAGELNPSEAVTKAERELKEECQKYMSQIARLGAGLGFRQILATQYPTGDVIPRQCKQNSDTKICFRVQNGTASRVVLDNEGAEKLPQVKGRAIYQTADNSIIVQTPVITAAAIQDAVKINIVAKKEKDYEEIKPKRREHTVTFKETRLS